MKTIHFILFSLSLLLITGFTMKEQTKEALIGGTKNFFLTPVDLVSNFFADKHWNEIKDDTQISHYHESAPMLLDNCGSSLRGEINAQVADTHSILNALQGPCTCRAWGSCSRESCSCSKLCPRTFDILDRGGQETSTSLFNRLYQKNSRNDFPGKTNGYCWGLATLTQKFNRLAFFKQDQPKKFEGEEYRDLRINEYKKIINRIINNKTAEIYGFSNLYEFTRDPEVGDLIREAVPEIWAENAVSWQGLSLFLSHDQMDLSDSNELFEDLKYRVHNHQAPTIVFSPADDGGSSHVVQVVDVRTDSTKKIVCLSDLNFPAENDSNSCVNHLILYPDGAWSYKVLGYEEELSKVKITHNENRDVVQQVESLVKKCQKEKNCN
jgi:hypothetical protein